MVHTKWLKEQSTSICINIDESQGILLNEESILLTRYLHSETIYIIKTKYHIFWMGTYI